MIEPWWRRPGRAWCAVAVLLAGGSVVALGLPSAALQWQPELAASQPWRALSAAWVHYSTMHLTGNAAGLALVTALGAAARTPPHLAAAWLAAWPLTQIGLLAQPALAYYGGASGVVHAGVAIACLQLIFSGRWALGATILVGLVAKVYSEAPWGPPLHHAEGWDIAIVPMAHASGLIAGVLCAVIAQALATRRRPGTAGGGK